jgi:hypothetical protein
MLRDSGLSLRALASEQSDGDPICELHDVKLHPNRLDSHHAAFGDTGTLAKVLAALLRELQQKTRTTGPPQLARHCMSGR